MYELVKDVREVCVWEWEWCVCVKRGTCVDCVNEDMLGSTPTTIALLLLWRVPLTHFTIPDNE